MLGIPNSNPVGHLAGLRIFFWPSPTPNTGTLVKKILVLEMFTGKWGNVNYRYLINLSWESSASESFTVLNRVFTLIDMTVSFVFLNIPILASIFWTLKTVWKLVLFVSGFQCFLDFEHQDLGVLLYRFASLQFKGKFIKIWHIFWREIYSWEVILYCFT